MTTECLSCRGLAGTPRISPGRPIFIGRFWQVEHAYPSRLVGWLVIVLRRHAIALHDLTPAEFAELGALLERSVRVVHEAFGSAKEYVSCYAEATGFEHIHFHVVPRAPDMPEEHLGAGSFELLRVHATEAVDPDVVRECCENLQDAFARHPLHDTSAEGRCRQ